MPKFVFMNIPILIRKELLIVASCTSLGCTLSLVLERSVLFVCIKVVVGRYSFVERFAKDELLQFVTKARTTTILVKNCF